MTYFRPRFPRTVGGGDYRTPFDDDPQVEAISAAMQSVYEGHALAPDDRARLLQLHRDLNGEHAHRRLVRKSGHQPDSQRLGAIGTRFIEFARRVGAVTREIEALDDI